MRRRFCGALCGAVLASGLLSSACAKSLFGAAPVLDAGARDPAISFRLPALRDGADSPVGQQLRELKVGRRALALGLTSRSAVDAWRRADATPPGPAFAGVATRCGALNLPGRAVLHAWAGAAVPLPPTLRRLDPALRIDLP